MYMGDHIVVSTGVGILLARRFKLAMVPIVTVMVAVNLIDFDHLIYFYKDDGFANSLTLHPLHIYAGVLIFLLALTRLVSNVRSDVIYCAMAGIALHLAADAYAYMVDYSIPIMVWGGFAMLVAFLVLSKWFIEPEYRMPVNVFVVIAWVVCYSSQAIIYYGLGIKGPESYLPWIMPQVWAIVLVSGFWLYFTRIRKISPGSASRRSRKPAEPARSVAMNHCESPQASRPRSSRRASPPWPAPAKGSTSGTGRFASADLNSGEGRLGG